MDLTTEKLSSSDTSKVEELDNSIQQDLIKLETLSDDIKKEKNQEIKKMIQYFNSLTKEIESRRNDIYKNSLQLLAISITAIGLLFSQKTNISSSIFTPIIFTLSTIVIFSIIIGIFYQVQSYFRYPFLKLNRYTNSWKWFYYGNKSILKISKNPFKKKFNLSNFYKPYLEGLKFEVNKYSTETLDDEIKGNIVQLYLLKVHNFYKNKFYLQLAWLQRTLFFFIVLVLILTLIFS